MNPNQQSPHATWKLASPLTIFRSTPVRTTSPTTIHSQVEVIHHGVLNKEDDTTGNLFQGGGSSGIDDTSVKLRLEVRL